MDYETKLLLPAQEADLLRKYMTTSLQPKDNVIGYAITFPDGRVMHLKCVGGINTSWTEGLLTDTDGQEICKLAIVAPGFRFLGKWPICTPDDSYTGIVEKGGPEIVVPTLAPQTHTDGQYWGLRRII